jgi:hypothetical protein
MLMQALFRITLLKLSHHHALMGDAGTPIAGEVDEEERALLAALKAVQDKKARLLQEAEEKRRAEEAEEKWKAEEVAKAKRKAEEAAETKRKAEEAEAKCKAEEKRKAEEAEAQRVEDEKIRAANEAMKVGVAAHMAEVQVTADDAVAARAKELALATCRKKLAKLGVTPDDPLMQAPEGPGPSQQEVRDVQREFSGKPEKRKVRETESSVCNPTSGLGHADFDLGIMHILCASGIGMRARDRESMHVMQC